MCENETPNEKNYRLLAERFGNENEPAFENRFQIKIELDFGNEPFLLNYVDVNGNETLLKVKKVFGNEQYCTLELENGNELLLKNENGVLNECRNENGNGNEL